MKLARNQAGVSMVEVMVALAVTLVLVIGLVSTFTSTSRTYAEITRMGEQIENGRYAVQLLHDDIQHAGFFGEYGGDPEETGAALVVPDPCIIDLAHLLDGVKLPIVGYDGAAADPLGCLPNYKPQTDVLVIRRSATVPVAAASLVDNTWYAQGLGAEINVNTKAGGGFDTPSLTYNYQPAPTPPEYARIFPYVLRIYYVAACSRCGADEIPTLRRRELVGGALSDSIPLVEGIEDIQFRYGIDQLNNGSPGIYRNVTEDSMAAMTGADWYNTMGVEVNVLARNTDVTLGYTDTKTYTLGTEVRGPYDDGYRRHVFSSVVRAVDLSGRRE